MVRNPRPRTLSPGVVRAGVLLVCAGGIAGMIAGSIADDNGVAVTFGLVTAAAALCLILVSAVSPPGVARVAAAEASDARPRAGDDGDAEPLGADVEAVVDELVAGGADEARVRELVRRAVRLGRALGR